MVEIIEKKLIQLSNSLCITIPQDWLRKFYLKKGGIVDLVIMDNAIMIVDRSMDFNEDVIIAGLNAAQKMWDEKEDRQQTRWLNKLTPEERAQVRKNWEANKEIGKDAAANELKKVAKKKN